MAWRPWSLSRGVLKLERDLANCLKRRMLVKS